MGHPQWRKRLGCCREIRLSPDGSIYALGSTRSVDFPTTADSVQRTFGGPDRDGFLLKLDSTGKIVYSTLLGGSKNDEPTSMSVAPNGTVFVGGVTMSADFPGSRAARLGDGGQADGFIAQFRPGDPNSLRTVLVGGESRDSVTGLEQDRSGNLFATGYTASESFPVKNAVQPHFGGGIDAFLVKLRSSDWNLRISSYVGGSKMDGAYHVSLDSAADPILAGVTESTDFPHTDSVLQPRLRGSVDAFVTKISGDGRSLLWSTYYGGSKANSDQFLGGSLAVDDAGRVWFTGMTSSADLPIHTPSQPVYGGGDFDGFLAALSSDGSKLCYASFFGGNGHDILEGLAVRGAKVYVSGVTSSANLEQKHSEGQSGYGGGPSDAFTIALDIANDRTCR
jgi:hypothetical protein